MKILRPTDRSQNFGRTKLLSDSETVGRALNFGRTKSIIESSIFHTKERAVNRVESISQNLFKFYCHFLGRRARGVFPVPLVFRKGFEVLPLADKRGSLEGVRERGFNLWIPISKLL